MKQSAGKTLKRITTGVFLLVLLLIIYFFCPPWTLSVCFIAILAIILALEWPKIGPALLATIYPVLPFIALVLINQSTNRHLLIVIFAVTWSFDTGSFLFGKLFGKIKITPQLSPGKTLEGLIGGIATSLLINYPLFHLLEINNNLPFFIPLIIFLNGLAFCGDMFVSFLKRKAGLKDTGSLLPGHGGFLDRFDGILPVAIAIYSMQSFLLK